MAKKSKSDRTSVTISKKVHREFKIAAAKLGTTQRDLLEIVIANWLQKEFASGYNPDEEED